MAQTEPMDVDNLPSNLPSDFDDKENSLQNSNVLPKSPSTEKGYEELDASEYSMKLRYSVTPANSPMSRSYTGNNKGDSGPNSLNNTVVIESNITRSLNSTMTKTDVPKTPKLPLQALPTSLYTNSDRRSCDSEGNVMVKVTGIDNDDNLSLPSTSSSAVQTPEATTPTKPDGSPIMRGLKSVLNLFRSSHSPVPPEDVADHQPETQEKQQTEPQPVSSTPGHDLTPTKDNQSNYLLASTPISNTKIKDSSKSSKRNSPLKDSVVFNQDLERELQWQDETEVFFKHEKIPIQKLLFPSGQLNVDVNTKLSDPNSNRNKLLNSTVENMDISNADISYKSVIEEKTLNDSKVVNNDLGVESDNDYLDCETTYTNKSHILETAQDNKSSQVLFQTHTIPHQTCLIEYIDSINKPDNVNDNITAESLVSETINKTSSVAIEPPRHLDELKSSAVTDINISDDSSRPLQNYSTFKTSEVSSIPQSYIEVPVNHANNKIVPNIVGSLVHIKNSSTKIESRNDESIHQAEVIIKNDVSLENDKLSNITDKPQIQTEDQMTTIQPFNQQSATVYQSSVETCTINKPTEFEMEMLRNLQNLQTNNTVMIKEDAINIGTDDENTTRILFDINTILNHVNPNYDKDEIPNTILNTSKNDLSQEETDINDTIVITSTENIEDNMPNLIEVGKESEITEELNDKTSVFNDNVLRLDDNKIMDTTMCKPSDINAIETSEFSRNLNIYVDDTLNAPNIDHEITEMECDSKETLCNSNLTVECTNNDLKPNEDPQDITMDSLEYHVNITNDHTHTQIKTVVNNYEFKCGTKLLENTLEQKHDEPSPLDVPLPSDDDIDLHSIKSNHNLEVTSEIITEKTSNDNSNFDTHKPNNQADIFKTAEELYDQAPFHLNNDAFNNISDKSKIASDVKMSTDFSNSIQEIPSQLSTNLTTCLQVMNVSSDIIGSQQTVAAAEELFCLNDTTTDREQQTNVDASAEITLPDVVQVITEINTPTNIQTSNEDVHLEDKTNAKVNDGEIVPSANNSPYVSVTELDLNLISNRPVQDKETPTGSEISISPAISPQFPKKGYNINFEDIENPFATKTNIRMSPLPGEENETFDPVSNIKEHIEDQRKPPNRRMSQPEAKQIDVKKKIFNTSINRVEITKIKAKQFSNKEVNTKHAKDLIMEKDNKKCEGNNLASNEEYLQTYNSIPSGEDYRNNTTDTEISGDRENELELTKNDEATTLIDQNYNNTFDSADQILNANKSDTRNVFNIPEIDDMNFNPFASKSRICVTPPPIDNKNIENDTATNINTTVCIEDTAEDETKVMSNASNITSSSINTDKDVTVRECNTEDDDTVEGPFFEAEDLVDVVKVPEIELKKDAMQFDDLPKTSNNDDIDKGEFFIDAEAFEFLMNQNKSNVVVDSGKESLFLKFDPLFAKRVSSDGVLSALSSIQKKQSTPKKLTRPIVDLTREVTPTVPVPGPSNVSSVAEQFNEATVSKPMMVVNPAVTKQPIATPRISLTPKTNRQSLNFMSPAMVVIDRLLSLSNNTSLLDQDVPTENSNDANIILVQLRELLADKELHVHSLKCESRELKDRLSTLESKVKSLESEGEARLRKVNSLNEQLAEKEKSNKSMAAVVEQYEWTIANMISEMQQEKKRNAEERARLISERDEQTAHLTSMERSFSDLHSKYEKCKQVILTMKANEDAYKKTLKDFEENLLKMQKNYDLLKQHATSKLNHANQELDKMNRAHEAEVLKLSAMIKRKELHIHSLEESLAQKSKAIEELTSICDELINKVG